MYFARNMYNPNITPAKSIQYLKESESHQCPGMNQLARTLEKVTRSWTEKEGGEDFASFWISDLIYKSKRQKKLKQNNVKIKEGILTDPVTVLLVFSST